MTTLSTNDAEMTERRGLLERYVAIRNFTESLTARLSPEDCAVQSMPDVSPTRWHLAHTSWFFETFLLSELKGYTRFHPDYEYLFNSYYHSVGQQFPRAQRGLLTRPGLQEVMDYRHHVDGEMRRWLDSNEQPLGRQAHVLEVGLQHEQQHQELILTDIKHVLSCNPTFPVYGRADPEPAGNETRWQWREFDEDIYELGHCGSGFSFDNETPGHRQFVASFAIADRPVTCGDFTQFIEDSGYTSPTHWLSLGWQTVVENDWQAPLNWIRQDGIWHEFTLGGLQPVALDRPICHLSYFEADAFARWAGARLPTEAEWEVAASNQSMTGNFVDTLLARNTAIHPARSARQSGDLERMFGDVWEWTSSSYSAYPGYQPPDGALGEYNGKFMCNQYVLRGGSCATSSSHIRRTYRNFFPPDARWQFSGLRLAADAG